MKIVVVAFSLTIASITLLTSCQSKKTENKNVASVSADSKQSSKIKDEVVSMVKSLPSTTETVSLINATGASYLAGFTGEDLKTENLLTRADKAKAYGTVIFDMAYTNIYNQVESFSKLVKVYETLTRDLGFEELVESQRVFKERYQQLKDNKDSVDVLVANQLSRTNDLIQKSGSASDIALVFGGAVAKSLNVISYLTMFAPGKEKLMDVLQKQQDLVHASCLILDKSSSDPEALKLLGKLDPVNKLFSSSASFDEKTVEEVNKLTQFIVN